VVLTKYLLRACRLQVSVTNAPESWACCPEGWKCTTRHDSWKELQLTWWRQCWNSKLMNTHKLTTSSIFFISISNTFFVYSFTGLSPQLIKSPIHKQEKVIKTNLTRWWNPFTYLSSDTAALAVVLVLIFFAGVMSFSISFKTLRFPLATFSSRSLALKQWYHICW